MVRARSHRRKGVATAALFAFGVAAAGLAGLAAAQQTNFPIGRTVVPGGESAVQSPVLTLDQARMYLGSAYGKRVMAAVEAARGRLKAENRKKEVVLAAEEKTLAQERNTMAPKAFEKLADAFNAKVQTIRHDQDAKNQIIQAWQEKERARFYDEALPVLGRLVRDSGAVAILNSQAVFLSFKAIDVTDRAIARLNATIGDGAKDAPPLDLDAPLPATASVGGSGAGSASGSATGGNPAAPVVLRPRAVEVPGVGEAVAPNGAMPTITTPVEKPVPETSGTGNGTGSGN